MSNLRLLSAPEVARRLGTDRRGVLRLVQAGALASERVGDRVMVRAADVEELQVASVGAQAATRLVLALVAAGWRPTLPGGN
jgi:excisionase family DNA binding protein